ncbi:unnamed protein product [Polarella glacialis]|uniref:C3H1-type domain-containing protein n=1 Tax=Polarella glacialis TaxID=89957 RepID=A0A813H8P0_POLGL|nr:unnamed protein product [Polarella glacialis]
MEAHRLGVCVPCKYFAWKVDGCRQGDNCSRCHFCTVDGAKSRKRQLRAEARQFKATTQAGTQCGNNQVEVQKDFGTFLSAADLGLQFQPSVKVQLTFAHCPDVNEASKGLPRRASAPILKLLLLLLLLMLLLLLLLFFIVVIVVIMFFLKIFIV